MRTLSVYLIVKNEESVIKRCIDSIISFSDEIIITDTGSTDKTKEIIKSINSDKIKLYDFEWCNDFSKARNFSLSKTSCDYVLTTDADEVFEKSLQNEIMYFKENNFFNFEKIYVPLVNFNENGIELDTLCYDSRSIIKKELNPYWMNPVHEQIHTAKQNLTNTKLKNGRILHKKHGGAKSQYNRYKEIFLHSINENFDPTNYDTSYFYYFNITMLWDDIPLSKQILKYCFDYRLLDNSSDFRAILLFENRLSDNEFFAHSLISDPSIKTDKNKIKLLFDRTMYSEDNDYSKFIAFEFFKQNRDNDLFKPYLKDVYEYLVQKELEHNFIKDCIETEKLLYEINNSSSASHLYANRLKQFMDNSRIIINSNSSVDSLIHYANRYFNDICVISNKKDIPSFCSTAKTVSEVLYNTNKKTLLIESENQFFSNEFRQIYEQFKITDQQIMRIG